MSNKQNEAALSNSLDVFLTNLVKLIPAEIVALYAVIQTFVPDTLTAHLFVSVPLFVLTPLYMYFAMHVKKIAQVATSTVAFAVWVFALGGPFVFIQGYESWMAGVVLALFTLVPPIIFGRRLPEERLVIDARSGKTRRSIKPWREI